MDSSPSPEWVLLFDGPCALCQDAVRWLMRRDRGKRLRYSPLQGDWAQEWKRRYAPGDVWPDEVILVAGEQHWIGADAIGTCLRILPFPYPGLGWIYAHLPGRKKIYRWLAKHRYNWFGKKDEFLTTCPAPRSWHEPRPHSC